MSELVKYIVLELVEHKEDIVINEVEKDGYVHLELHVAESDMGKVIGKHGRIAMAIRAILRSASAKEEKKYVLDII